MKITAFLIVAASLHVAARTNGQTVTLDLKNVPVQKVFREVSRQSGISILYNEALLRGLQPVTIKVKNASVQDVLDQCLRDQPLKFIIQDNSIVIREKAAVATQDNSDVNAPPPPIDVTGRITNEQGEPLAGASVIIKRTGRGDIADAQGDFHLKDVTNDDYIIISFAGYKTQTIKVGSITKFTIVMQITNDDLDKVVIQAYGTTTQRLATGNITTVRAEQIERQPVMNPLAALEGQVPGLVVQQTNGYASAPFKLEIRGRSVIDASLPSDPLYIIDGVPLSVLTLSPQNGNYVTGSSGFVQSPGFGGPAGGQSPFFSINPEDIESITVLKDADATAIYGSRGANGVIIIKTKNGDAGKSKFDINVYQGMSEVVGRYDLLNTKQYLEMRREAFKNDEAAYGLIPGVTIPDEGNAYDLLSWDTTRYTNWQNFLWGQMGHVTEIESNLSGGDKQNTFRISGSYHRETGIATRSGADQRGSVQFNYAFKSLDRRLNVSLTSLYSQAKSDMISVAGNVLEAPNAPAVLNSHGELNFAGWDPVPYNLTNFGSLFQPYTSQTGFLNSQLRLEYEILRGFSLSTELGFSSMHSSQTSLVPIISQDPTYNPVGNSSFGNTNLNNSIVEPHLEYNAIIGKGKLNILAGGTLQYVNSDANFINGSGYINDNLLRSISNAPIKNARDGSAQYKYEAVFGRINYNLENKYILNLSARRDGSSRFGPGKQFGNFGAIGIAWIFTEERWIKDNLPYLSFGKLRMSYGITGSDQIGDYNYLTRWSASNTLPYQNITSYSPLQLSNPNLEWQSNYKLEAALDLGFLNDRLSLEVAWYRNRCSNQLVYTPLPIITGFSTVTANSPALVENKGVETILKTKIIEKKNFSLSTSFNIGINRNKLLSFPNLSQSQYASAYVIGQSLSIAQLVHYTGVDPLTGQYTFQDRNHDGQITYYYNGGKNDLYNIDLAVKYDGGFGADMRYKDFLFNIFFTFRSQIEPSSIYNGSPGYIEANQSVQVLDRWQKPGDKKPFARFTTQQQLSDIIFSTSDGRYSNGSYVRLRNISLSYKLPKAWIRKAGMKDCKIYVRGENLFVLTKYNGLDPATPALGSLPPLRIFTGGVQFNF